eukprot:jgi/Ulvmu1/416/UM001_0423.1
MMVGFSPPRFTEPIHITNFATYRQMHERSIKDPEGFWAEIAEQFTWSKKWDKRHMSYNFDLRRGPIHTEWFKGGMTNLCYNCLDRNIQLGRGGETCFIWEGNEPVDSARMTYAEVLAEVCRIAGWLRGAGVSAGDAVMLYMPMVPQLPMALLACARIGAVHCVVFGGFSAEALAGRTANCGAKVLLTASGFMRGKKTIHLKRIADEACRLSAVKGTEVRKVLVLDVQHASGVSRGTTSMLPGRDVWYDDVIPQQPPSCEPLWVPSEHPLFLLYTSGSTGNPKGIQHTTGGYMVYAATSVKYSFSIKPGDVYWCTGDCGWVTGHTDVTYGPLLNGAASLVFEGIPTYPHPGRPWEVIAKHRVNKFHTAPTAIRSLMVHGSDPIKPHDLSCVQMLGTVGESINPAAWEWYKRDVGGGNVPVVDTYWQTETGGILLCNMPGAWPEKPGSATFPFFGIDAALLDPDTGQELHGPATGVLCIKQAWPATLRGVYGDCERFESTYFSQFKGYYVTGDNVRRDEDGYYWVLGRMDDIINVSGHRIGTAEVESALVAHPACAEAAAVGYDHPIKGLGIYAFVTPVAGATFSDALQAELRASVKQAIGAFAVPDIIHHAPGLPKTRSGKIMRRILRKIAAGQHDDLGDVSTLADPSVVAQLVQLKPVKSKL